MKEFAKKRGWYLLIPALGLLFSLYYIKRATSNIVYTDYIRLVISYLPDVYNPDKFFVPDLLTRIPLNYLGRIINVELFDYSTTFDMGLGALGLALSAWILAWYAMREQMGIPAFLTIMAVMFSLNKWEMLTNGTGWCHFMAFALFYFHYVIADRVLTGREQKGDRVLLLVLPSVIVLGVAGPYCASYAVTLGLVHGVLYLKHLFQKKNVKSWHFWYGLAVLLPMLAYLWSNSQAYYAHSGATDLPLITVLREQPEFFVSFFLKSFASMILGIEVAGNVISSGWILCLLGLGILACYAAAFWLYARYRMWEETYMPLFCLTAGLTNHLLILAARWIFLQDIYGMASRYALQYQIGMIGIIMVFSRAWKYRKRPYLPQAAAALFAAFILLGNGYTTRQEWLKAPGRENYQNHLIEMARHYEDIPDEELITNFQYHSADSIRQALDILKEQGWNVFSYQ